MCSVLLAFSVAGCGKQGVTEVSSVISENENFSSTQETLTYEDIYNQAREEDEKYWKNIPDTDPSDFDYYILDSDYIAKQHLSKVIIDGKEYIEYGTNYFDPALEPVLINGYLGDNPVLKIPSYIDGHPVTFLSDQYYTNDNNIGNSIKIVKEVYIPDTVMVEDSTIFSTGPSGVGIEKLRLPCIMKEDEQRKYGYKNSDYPIWLLISNKNTAWEKIVFPETQGNLNLKYSFDRSYENIKELYFGVGTKEIIMYPDAFPKTLEKIAIPSTVDFIGKIGESYYDEWGQKHNGKEIEANIFDECKNLTVICERGSYAAHYAEKYGIKTKELSEVSISDLSLSEKNYDGQ